MHKSKRMINSTKENRSAFKITSVIPVICTVAAAFAFVTFTDTHAVWMVPTIYFFGGLLYIALSGANDRIGSQHHNHQPLQLSSCENVKQPELTNYAPGETLAPITAGIAFSYAEAVAARGGHDDGCNIVFCTNASGATTPYGM